MSRDKLKIKDLRVRNYTPGTHCRECDGPVTSLCAHTSMTSRERRRLAKREGRTG